MKEKKPSPEFMDLRKVQGNNGGDSIPAVPIDTDKAEQVLLAARKAREQAFIREYQELCKKYKCQLSIDSLKFMQNGTWMPTFTIVVE